MSLPDRVGRSLFVALAVGMAWGIRGDFGHLIGAMYPGAALAMALAYVSGQASMAAWMPVLAALAALGIGSGGTMSYGMLHGYAQADIPVNYAYGFGTLFLQGSAWGTFGGALIGLMLERRPMRTADWLALAACILGGGWVASFLVVDVLGFQINPPRNNGSIGYFGAAIGQIAWLVASDRRMGLRGAVLGYVGFGLGMAGGRLLGNLANVGQVPYGYTINHWNVMETSCGMIAGFIYAFGMLGQAFPTPAPEDRLSLGVASAWSIAFVLAGIPAWHRLARIQPQKKLAEWSGLLGGYGYADPDGLARKVLWMLDGTCVLGLVGAALWMAIYLGHDRNRRPSPLPVLWLSLTMLLFQNINALYFFYPIRPNLINMHSVFWVLFALMALYAAFARPSESAVAAPEVDGLEPEAPFAWAAWLGGSLVALTLIILLAGLVNGPTTMATANTRWPVWSWSQGPFPGRVAGP
ncbi:hypothetical protein EP7_005369 [Isosphaeraceae bacterium EP7]